MRRSTTRRALGLAAVVIRDSDGNLVSRNRGAPGGELVADVDFWVAGPHPALELEPCDIATELID